MENVTERRGFADRRPVAVPESWAVLQGPSRGPVSLPADLGWTGRRDYDLDDPADARVLYERVLVDAVTAAVLVEVLNGDLLKAQWPQLFLPHGVRAAWEARFPELATAA